MFDYCANPIIHLLLLKSYMTELLWPPQASPCYNEVEDIYLQCDQMAVLFFNIWPFSARKFCPKA